MMFIKYFPGDILGQGRFSQVYELKGTKGKIVAKVEKITPRNRIVWEYTIYCALGKVPFVPKVKHLMQLADCYVMVMENAGISLEDFLAECNLLHSMRQTHVAYYASRMISALAVIHSRGVIHGDIRPEKFMVRKAEPDVVRLIDFGSAIQIGEVNHLFGAAIPAGGSRTAFKDGWEVNYRFVSLHLTQHPHDRPSIADDLVSLGYTLIYFINRHLPWEALIDASGRPTDVDKLVNAKRLCNGNILCEGLPAVFHEFLTFALNLTNLDAPTTADYDYYCRRFQDLAEKPVGTR